MEIGPYSLAVGLSECNWLKSTPLLCFIDHKWHYFEEKKTATYSVLLLHKKIKHWNIQCMTCNRYHVHHIVLSNASMDVDLALHLRINRFDILKIKKGPTKQEQEDACTAHEPCPTGEREAIHHVLNWGPLRVWEATSVEKQYDYRELRKNKSSP